MKFLKRAGLVLLALVAVLAITPAFLPAQVHVERSMQLDARPEHVYPDLATLRTWNDWSAWNEREDPEYHRQFEGPETGVGSTIRFTSHNGPGVQRITRADPATGVDVEMLLGEDGAMRILATISLTPKDGGTRVTWSDTIDYSKSYPMRLFGPVMDGILGEHILQSLQGLARRAEARRAEADRAPHAQSPQP